MARKSRRGKNNKLQMENEIRKDHESIAGVYLRISSKDKTDSDSIHNQKSIVDDYLEAKTDIKVFKYYIDEGISSYRDSRPAFEEMMHDIKCGLINTLVVKDISRFGRNYIETGTYLETIFPRVGIRFISIGENIDSLDVSNSDYEIALKSIINHFYSHDISMKVKSVVKQKQLTGEYIAARVPYGYKKSIDAGKTKYVLDQEKATVVNRIFDMTLKGLSYYQIAGALNHEEIKSPGNTHWTVKSVSRITNNCFYTGVLEAGKTENTFGGMKPFANKDKHDWIVIESHHEALIKSEAFEEIKIITDKKRDKSKAKLLFVKQELTSNEKQKRLFDGLLYCGDCGRKMKKQTWAEKISFICPKYSETQGTCSLKSWREDRLIIAQKSEMQAKIDEYEMLLNNANCPTRDKHFESDSGYKFEIHRIESDIERFEKNGEIIYDDFVAQSEYDQSALKAFIYDKNQKMLNLKLQLDTLKLHKDDYDKNVLMLNQLKEALSYLESLEESGANIAIRKVISRIKIFDDHIETAFI